MKFDENIPDLHSLPEPYRTVVQQLAALSYEAIDRFQLIFTLDDIRIACPQIDSVPGALNCFGLLQVVKYFGDSGTMTSVNFLHLSVQEFLAAYHISCLPHHGELNLLNERFMSPFSINIFKMYIGLTRGQRPAFVEYLTGCKVTTASEAIYPFKGMGIKPELVKSSRDVLNFLLRLHGVDNQELCTEIIKASNFSKGVIDFDNSLLFSRNEIECLGLLFTTRKEWLKLGLYHTFQRISDTGIRALHEVLSTNNTVIHEINLCGNNLTPSVTCLVVDIVKYCQTKALQIQYNSLPGILPLLMEASSLKYLCVDVTDKESIVSDIIGFLQVNKSLKVLCLHKPSHHKCEALSNESAMKIAHALKHNDTLKILRFPVVYRGLFYLPKEQQLKNEDLWNSLTTDCKLKNFEVIKEGNVTV